MGSFWIIPHAANEAAVLRYPIQSLLPWRLVGIPLTIRAVYFEPVNIRADGKALIELEQGPDVIFAAIVEVRQRD
jgi:hypothetical protein